MKHKAFPLFALLGLQGSIQTGNKNPEPAGPITKTCKAPKGDSCTVSVSKGSKTATCTAFKESTCTVEVNAIKILPKVDVKTAPKKALGTISKDTQLDIELPQKEGSYSLFTFTPTAGDFTGKEIYFLIYRVETPPGTRLHGKTALDMYRYLSGDKPDNWVKMGEFESSLPADQLKTALATIKPDGTVSIPSAVQGDPPVNMAAGKKLE